VRGAKGYQLKLPFPVSSPIDPQGKGNGKHSLAPGEDGPRWEAIRAPVWGLQTADGPGGLRSEGVPAPSPLLEQQKSDKSIAGEPALVASARAQGVF